MAAAILLLGASHGAMAQTEAAPKDADIIVTGSRIVRNGDSAPQPVTLVRTEELLKQTPTTLADGLNALPVFAGSRGPGTSVATTGNAAGGNGAANQLNLRSLGAIRNLILLDGQRLPTALFNGVVDVDIVPDMLIERVDVVTGGVSAVYGSDAISGVVNFVTNRKFNGFKAEAQTGISQRGDAPQYKAAFAAGKALGDNAHIEASYTYFSSDPLFYRTDRDFGYDYAYGGLKTPTSTYGAAGTINNPYVLVSGARNSSATYGGKITSGLYNNTTFNANGVLSPFNAGTVTASPNLSIGGDGFYNNASLGATQRSHQGFTRFDYKLSPDVNYHLQGLVSIKDNTSYSNYAQFSNFTIRANNPYLPTSMQTALAAAGQNYFTFAKVFNNAQRLTADVRTEQFYVNTGFDGKFGGFDWDVSLNYGKAKLSTALSGNINNQHLAAAADAVTNGSGQIVCGINADAITSNDDASCKPINLFGPTAASQDSLNYILGTTHLWSYNQAFDIGGHLGGRLFDLGAGDARFAVSAQYRTNSLRQTVDVASSDTANCSGLVINPINTATQTTFASNCVPVGALQRNTNGTTTPLTPTALYQNAFSPMAEKVQRVKEVAVEVDVPLLKDSALGRMVGVTGALRYAHYNTTGSAWVWKGGLNWKVTDDLRLRGTISRDFRAPTLNDLYQAPTVTVANNADLLTGASFLQSRTQGNPNLRPEVGHTWTLGAVFKPRFMPGFSVALDYYNIRITDAIQSVSGFQPAIQQACLSSGGASPFCSLQPRPNGYSDTSVGNAPYYWLTQNLNFAEITTQGLDADINYATRVAGRPVSLRVMTTWQPEIIYGQQPGASGTPVSFNAAGASNANGTVNNIAAKWRVNANLHVEPTNWMTTDLRARWRSGYRYNPDQSTYFAQAVPAAMWLDTSVTFKLPDSDRYQLFFNVQNLLDKAPPPYQTGILPGQGFVPGDDFIGRYFLAGVRVKY
ncbi:TonB-dependent receptor [Novosphingobium umbonatum]|uniref:TonB-dependent receptor n=1 Tax=Novosphingobium umbonatum TaxID=1908524 RepID=A0A437MZW1_9SPHN|nr:TonB-dependent receptor [Novosphingobium umbonatum]RVU03207.1 TonB-dependent receptor [Novosphingobium umbonatum]